MSNYNTQLQSNNTDLQKVLQTLRTKAAGGGEQEDIFITKAISGNYFNDRVTTVGGGVFAGCSNLTAVNFPACTTIDCASTQGTHPPIGAFQYCSNLTTVSFPACTRVGSNAFYRCYNLTTANFPVCTTIEEGAFQYCNLTTVSFPACTRVGSNAFEDCDNLTTVSFPVCTSIRQSAFYDCSNLTTVSFPACTDIGGGAFRRCRNLKTVSFPVGTSIGGAAFYDCSNLTTVSFPACTTIGSYAFCSCSNLTTVSFPACTIISDYTFCSCNKLTTVSFPVGTNIRSGVFKSCYNLKSLYLTGSNLCTLAHSNAFSSTPIGGYSASAGTYGSIYVPASLLTSYQTATNWTYFSSRFVAYDDNTGGIITFTINGTSYQAENNMTWAEWIDSEYNVDNYIVDPEESMYIMDYMCNGFVQFENNYVSIDEAIQNNTNYAFGW